MHFDLNDEQQEIKRTAHEFLASRFKPEKVRELADADSYDDGLWREISELGWPGIAIAEDDGGQGLGMVELSTLLEESGYVCAPSPLLGTAGAALVISAAGSDEQRSEWLPKLASGEATGSFGGFADGQSTLFCDLPTADVVVTFDGEGALLAPASEVDFEPLRGHRLDPFIRLGLRRGRGAAPGRRRRRSRPARCRDRGRADGHRAAHARDGDRLRARAPAVRPPDRRLPGGQPPDRGDAARHRGVALPDLLRVLDRRRRAGVTADGGGDGRARVPQTPAGRSPPPHSRSSAASASPGSTTSSSGSSAGGSPAACSARRGTTASGSPTSPGLGAGEPAVA